MRRIVFAALIAVIALLAPTRAAFAFKQATQCYTGPFTINTPSGSTLHHPEVSLIFWGSQWKSPGQPVSYGAMIASVQTLVNSSYFSELNQYGSGGLGIEAPRMVPEAPIYTGAFPGPGGTFTNCDINNVINIEIANGAVPAPTANIERIYVVFLPSGVNPARNNAESGICPTYFITAGGQHQQCTQGSCACPNGTCPNQPTFYWARILSGGAGSTPTVSLSHELVEAITNPSSSAPGSLTLNEPGTPEIADMCNCTAYTPTETQNGVPVQSYWSQADQACVIPEGYQYTWSWNGTPNSWQLLTADVARQLYSGYVSTPNFSGFELLLEDNADNVNFWRASTQGWTTIAGPPAPGGAEYAVTHFGAWAMARDASTMFEWTDGVGWQDLHFPSAPVTAIFGGGLPIATDATNHMWRYNGTGWTNIGSNVDKIVENDQYFVILERDHQIMSLCNATDCTNLGGPASDIFTGGGGATAVGYVTPGSSRAVNYLSSVGASWNAVGNSSSNVLNYVIGGPGQLFGLTAGSLQGQILEANIPSNPNAGWTSVATTSIKMVGQGDTLYASNYVAY